MLDNLLVKSQQYLLATEGHYTSRLDGVWGSKSQVAMREFSKSPAFNPATVNDHFNHFVPYCVLPSKYEWVNVSGQRIVVAATSIVEGVKVSQKDWISLLFNACETGLITKRVSPPSPAPQLNNTKPVDTKQKPGTNSTSQQPAKGDQSK